MVGEAGRERLSAMDDVAVTMGCDCAAEPRATSAKRQKDVRKTMI
jgi:hypothetical protein